jgi:hypothetical protein
MQDRKIIKVSRGSFYNKKIDLKICFIFVISIIFYLKVLKDITWFENELQEQWLLKRIIFATFMSIGYLAQHVYFKSHFYKTSKVLLVLALVCSAISSLLGSLTTFLLFILILVVLFDLGHKNVLA